MKRTKRIASVLLALVMALSLITTAFAAGETYSITIKNDAAGHTYEAYQIFAGDLAIKDGVKTLSNIRWGSGVSAEGQAALGNAAEKAAALVDTAAAEAFAKEVAPYLQSPASSTEAAGRYTISGLSAGYYLVKDKDNTLDSEHDFYTAYIMQVVGNVEAQPKGDKPSVDKKIDDNNQKVDTNEASIGDKVSYVVTSHVPDMTGYNKYYFVLNDTMSKGLTFNDDVAITIGGKALTKTDYTVTSTLNADGSTSIKIVLNNFIQYANQKNAEIVVTYSATLNENAEIGANPNTNKIDLVYSNDPNYKYEGDNEPKPGEPTGKTPESVTKTYTTELTVKKTDAQGHILPGAEFTLTGIGVNIVLVAETRFVEDTNGTYWKLTNGSYTTTEPTDATKEQYASTETRYSEKTVVTTKGTNQGETVVKGFVNPTTGEITFTGLGAGDYVLTETVTPAGYNTIEPIRFTISFDAATKKFSSSNPAITLEADNTLYTTVINQTGAELPSTGGIGTTIFYVVGGLLVVAAGVLLVTRKRMSKSED